MDLLLVFIAFGVIALLGSAYAVYRWGWIAVALFFAIIGIAFLIPKFSIEYLNFLSPFIIGITGGYTFKKGKTLTFYMVTAAVALAVLLTGQYYYKAVVEKVDLIDEIKKMGERTFNELGTTDEVRAAAVRDFNGMIEGIGRQILPFLFFLNSLFYSALGFVLMPIFFRRFPESVPVKGLEYFRMRDYVIFILILGWGSVLLIDRTRFPMVSLIGLNLALTSSVLYFIQALGVIKYMLVRRGLPTYILPLAFLIMTVLGVGAMGFSLVMLIGLGTLDLWADFRKLEKNTT